MPLSDTWYVKKTNKKIKLVAGFIEKKGKKRKKEAERKKNIREKWNLILQILR